MKIRLNFYHQHVKHHNGIPVIGRTLRKFNVTVSMTRKEVDALEAEMNKDFRLEPRIETSDIVFNGYDS